MRRLTHLLIVLVLLCSAPALADDEEGPATDLFREGRAALKSGDYDLACAKFEQSLAIDVRVGTVLNLGACNEQRGRLATALEHWKEGIRLATQAGDERATMAGERARKLEPRVPTLTIELAGDTSVEVRIVREGRTRVLSDGELGTPLLLDPGKIDVVAAWTDGEPSHHPIALVAKQHERLVLTPPRRDTPAATTTEPSPAAPPSGDAPSEGLGAVRIAGIAIAAVGVVGLGVAGGLAGVAAKKNGDSNDDQNPELCSKATDECGPTGDALRDDAIGLANGATGALIAGGVLLAAGVTMILAAPSEDATDRAATPRVQLRVGAAELGVGVHW